MKKRIPSIVIYILNMILVFVPWLTIGEKKYNTFGFVRQMIDEGTEKIIIESGLGSDMLAQYKFGIYIGLVLFAIYVLGGVFYIIFMFKGKRTRLNIMNCVIMLSMLGFHMSGISLAAFSLTFQDICVLFAMFFLTVLEFFVRTIAERWEEMVTGVREYETEEAKRKREERERLRFDGKYTSLFYKFVWKNFRKNIGDYTLLLISNTILFGCVVMGFGMKEMLAVENTSQGTRLFNGLNRILVNATIPMGIIAVFIFVLLFFHYVKCRSGNFGVFLTLGMRRNMLYRFVAIEYISMLLLAISMGSLLATGNLVLFTKYIAAHIGIAVSLEEIGVSTYLKAVLILLLVSIVSLMSAKEIFRDFNVGNSTDLRAVGEKLPVRFRKVLCIVGIGVCCLAVNRYRNLDNFENIKILLVFFIGLFLIIRYGMAEYLIRERKSKRYLKKLMMHHQLFHKSKTSAGYMGAFFVIQFCILFYFMFQMTSANISEEAESLFPYDIVCLADDSDDEFFKGIRDTYDVKMQEYPALRVSALDSTEEIEDIRTQIPIQGQHIGISESTYHALKRQLDNNSETISLDLNKEGKNIHVVYQQDRSEHAKPTAFYTPRSKPLLRIGQPCRTVNLNLIARMDLSYDYYEVKSEERGSLIGNFHQGTKENIIVFSDEYFETAKDFWKTRNINTGALVEEGEDTGMIPIIHQGITKLILLNVDQTDYETVAEELLSFEKKHRDEEEALYAWNALKAGIYDRTVSYHYRKVDAVKNLKTERVMKMVMNGLVIVVFFFMNIMLLIIKLLSEREMNLRRTEFLRCMGMRKKDRIRIMRKEILKYYYILPTAMAAVMAGVFTISTFFARMYDASEWEAYLRSSFLPVGGYLLVNIIVTWTIVTIYAYRMEANLNEGNTQS